MTQRLVLATANPGKVTEIQAILREVFRSAEGPGESASFVVEPRPTEIPDVVEDADTLVGNARLKAQAVRSATGAAALADDTGLEVAALDGRPGVRTARFAGEEATDAENIAAMIEALDGADDRRARFRTVALFIGADGTEMWAEGVMEGVINSEPRGAAGFGYDPIFEPVDHRGSTLAELQPEQKNRISHRGRAFSALAARLLSAGTVWSPRS